MAKHRSIIAVEHDEGQEARVTVGPPDDQSWFRLFRGIVRTGIWADLGSGARSVLVVLAESVNDNLRRENGQWLAWPSVPTIAKRAGLAERNVYVALRELEAKDLIRKIAPGGGRRQTTYELRAPKAAEKSEPAPTLPSGVTKASGVTISTGVPRPPRQVTPDLGVTQQRESISRTNHNSSGEESKVLVALREAGVAEPTLTRLVTDHEEAEVLLRLEDWKNRKAAGSKLGVAWLIASIQHKYDLHESTHRAAEQRAQATAASAHRLRQLEAEEAEARRQREIEEQVTTMFEAMSDEELDHWKGVVVAEFPSLIKNPERADPRANDRLRRLILGKLAHLVAPPDPVPAPVARATAAKRGV